MAVPPALSPSMRRMHGALALGLSLLLATPVQAATPPMRLQHGPIERETFAGRIVLHQAVCAASPLPLVAHCHAHVLVDAQGNEVTQQTVHPSATTGAPGGFGPGDLRAAYKITQTGAATRTIAIVDSFGYPNAEADLAAYRKQYGLPACTTANGCFIKINQRGGTSYPAFNLGWAQETALDLDMASALCPGCKIMLVQADNDTLVNLGAAVKMAVAKGAKYISNSYGGGEAGTATFDAAYRQSGVVITASAGDSGYGVEYPASSPGVIAVGGTALTQAPGTARGWAETTWSGTGSGCSTVYAKPAWQTDKLCTKRMVTDIALVASPATPVAVYGPTSATAAAWMRFGGTSASAPILAGIYAAIGTTPNAAQSIWAHRGSLFDVTTGTNGKCGNTYFCTSAAGYDGPTGNGTPNGAGSL